MKLSEMSKRFTAALFIVVTLVCITQASPVLADATVIAPASGGSGLVSDCSNYAGITNRIVMCVRDTLDNAGEKFFSQFFPMVSRAVMAIITLGVIIYGVMMAAGMVEKIGRDSLVLLIKVAFVIYFVQNTDVLYQWVTDGMDALSAAMFNFSTINHPTAPVCMIGKESVWERLDCLVDTTFGIRNDAAAATAGGSVEGSSNLEIGGHGLTRGLMAFFGSALVSSVPGFIIGLVGFMFLYSMLFFMVKVVFMFLMAYMGLMFLMMIGPLFIPLVIFRTTKQYFDKWVGLIIAFALQPVIIVAFVSFAVAAVDVTVFSGEKSFVRTIAGNAADQVPFNLNEYIKSKNGYVERTRGPQRLAEDSSGETQNVQMRAGIAGVQAISECGLRGRTAEQMAECAQGWVVGISTTAIDWEVLAKERQPAVELGDADNKEEALMKELYASGILTAVMMFVVGALMKVVPQIANDLVGSYRQTPNVFGTGGKWNWQSSMGTQISRSMQDMATRR